MPAKPAYPLTEHAFEYARDVLGGNILTCKWTRLACQRFMDDIEHGKDRGIYFDFEAAEHRLSFYDFIKHSKGEWAGTIFHPEPWQAFMDANIFGWKREDGARRFRTIYASVARKNGKSSQLAATGLYLAFFDEEEGAEVFTAAGKYDQACIIHSESTRMVKSSSSLRGMITIFKNTLTCEAHNQKYVPLGQDSNTQDGLNVHAALIDEYHCHPTSGLYDVLKTGTGSRRQPMVYVITTAGFEKNYPCFEMEARIKRILEGSEIDDSVFGIVYSLDEEDDWTDERLWAKANPNMGVSLKLDVLQDNFKEAFSVPSKQNNFKTKHMNLWTEAETRWITMDSWKLNSDPVDADGLAGRLCFTALDLSTTIDLTAWVLCFPPDGDGDKYRFLYRFFIPQEGIHERTQKEKFDYETMVRLGFITATPGNVVDYDFIKAQIYEDVKKYDIRELAYDPWNATSIITDIQNEIGATCVEFRQGFASMSPACKDFERKVLSGKLATGGNPVMNWMIGCVEVTSDPAGNIKLVKPDRQRTGKHIDGVVASVMALDRAIKNEGSGVSSYETEELLIL